MTLPLAALTSAGTRLDSTISESVRNTTGSFAYLWVEHEDHDGTPASFGGEVAIAVSIAVMWIWSGVLNLVTILAITTNRHMRTRCNYFILSLAVSDLISGVIASPLWLYRRIWGFEEWLWGDFLCKTFWFVDESTSYCTAMHIASFAVWRYIGVKWPHAVDSFTKLSIKIWVVCIWAVALIFGGCIFSTFYAVRGGSHAERLDQEYAQWPSCSVKIPDNGVQKHLIYYTFSSTTFMLLPMFILIVSSMLIARELYLHRNLENKCRRKKEKKAVCQLGLISASFLFGYVPMTAYVMWTTRSPRSNEKLDYWLHVASYFTLRLSECMNPIIYNIASERMRRASYKVITDIRYAICNMFRSKDESERAKQKFLLRSRRRATKKSAKVLLQPSYGRRTPGYTFPPKPKYNTARADQNRQDGDVTSSNDAIERNGSSTSFPDLKDLRKAHTIVEAKDLTDSGLYDVATL